MRSWKTCVPGFVLGTLLAAAPAHGYTLIGANHAANPTLAQAINMPPPTLLFNASAPPGIRLAAPAGGVITRWRMHVGDVAAGNTLRLRVLEPVGAGEYRVVRSGPLHTMPALTGQANQVAFDVSVPVAAGQIVGAQVDRPVAGANEVTLVHITEAPAGWTNGYFLGSVPADGDTGTATISDGTIAGASDPFFPISADVEPDADGDGFGDETRDRCPGSGGPDVGCPAGTAGAAPALPPARGITTLGPTTEPDPATAVAIGYAGNTLVFNATAMPGVELLAQERGVITRWQVHVGEVTAGSTVQLRVLQRVGDDRYSVGPGGPKETLGASSGEANLRTFPARVPIQVGQQIGVATTKPAGGTLELTRDLDQPAPAPWSTGRFQEPFIAIPAEGAAGFAYVEPSAGGGQDPFYAVTATVERDTDGDAFGDHTQDRCPDAAGPDQGCPVPVPTPEPTPAPAPQTVVVREPPVVQVTTVVPETALARVESSSVKVDVKRTKLTATVSCPVQKATTCTGRLAGKVRVRRSTLSLGSAAFRVASGRTRSVTLKVPARTRRAITKLKQLPVTLTVTGGTTLTKRVR